MLRSLFSKPRIRKVCIPTTYTVLVPCDDVVDGQLVKQSSFKTVDLAAPEYQFQSSDFSIGNLLAVGSYDILKQTCLVNTSRLNAADSFDNFKIESDVQ